MDKTINDENDVKYLTMAFLNARDYGTDPSTQNGAVIVNQCGQLIGVGANHFPEGVQENNERWQRPLKYQFVEHAERNSIFHAAKEGHKLAGTIMYCGWFACADCARAIIQSGITEVVGHQKCFDLTPVHWKESINNAFAMFKESGVKTRTITCDLGVTIRFNGENVDF